MSEAEKLINSLQGKNVSEQARPIDRDQAMKTTKAGSASCDCCDCADCSCDCKC